jgi:Lon protease-like protein
MNEDEVVREQFRAKGTTRLFPLPNLVFFPRVIQPLHIFEPRYRQMIADSLADDRLVTLVLLQPGWEGEYDQQPTIHSIACLGRIIADQQLPDGRYNLLLRGVSRVRLGSELPGDGLYRQANAELLSDDATSEVDSLMGLRHDLAAEIVPFFRDGPLHEQIGELFQGELPLGTLCDVLAFALPVTVETKQAILEALSVSARAQLLLDGFRQIMTSKTDAVQARRKFPPDFSSN